MKNKTAGDKIFHWGIMIFLTAAVAVAIIPFFNIISVSLSSSEAITKGEVGLFPIGFNTEAYKTVLNDASMIFSLGYTIALTLIYTLLAMLVTLCGAYALAQQRLYGRIFMTIIVITMYFDSGVIPQYLLNKSLGITNTALVLVLPCLLNAYNMIVLKTFVEDIPASIEESARLDGATDFTIMFKIILPLLKPAIATVSLFYAVSRWNTFQDVIYYIQNTSLFTLQYKLQMMIDISQSNELTQFEGANLSKLTPENLKSASIIFAAVPIMAVYPFAQKYFVKGVTLGSVKG